ncbi:MAG: arginyltransferase [Kiloniellaceae bacterium]
MTAIGGAADNAGRPQQVFYVLTESPCPYLPGRRERKLITEVSGPEPGAWYNLLARAGFRRSHHYAYRPACSGCAACVPVRVAVKRFRLSRSLKRVARLNAGLNGREQPARASREQFELFKRYIVSRHDDGEMAGMSFADYRGMVERSRIDTRVAEFRGEDGRLVAACLVDWLPDGPSAVYSFFDPDLERRSLGTFMVLWLIERAHGSRRPYVYLGYWIREAPKMAYKTRFRPLEALGPAGWQVLEA